MSLINLSEKAIQDHRFPLYKRMMNSFHLDVYAASSLTSIEEFKIFPPKKYEFGCPTAYVMMRGLLLKPIDDIERMPDKMHNPQSNIEMEFQLTDSIISRTAVWSTDAEKYLEVRKLFGIYNSHYTSIPKILLKYRKCRENDMLFIESFFIREDKNRGRTKRLTDIVSMVSEIIPDIGKKVQPGFT